ncbi:MAG TPA: hypothetical protein VHU43_00790 [Steroidobacteraceae bacterium]|jgi:hypothetical protein|nr:hypothetical protein [Steroidobacteraceae bacterium]
MHISDANIRSPRYYIAHTQAQCAHCGQWNRVLALALPPNHEMVVDGRWQTAGANAFLFYIADLPRAVSRRLTGLSPGFRLASGEGQRNSYWANHCKNCGRMFSDDGLHCEPGGFMPTQGEEAEAIQLSHVRQGFSAIAAGYALDPEFFGLIKKR